MPQRNTDNAAFTLQSKAFERASLKSEKYRVIALLCVLIVTSILVVARGVATQNTLLLIGQIVVLAFVIAHESVMLHAIKTALRDDEAVLPELWVFNVLIESQIPTVALLVLLLAQWMTPHQVLVAPAIVLYFLFITLSTLRLRPSLTFVTGLLSALGYLLVTFYVQLQFGASAATANAFPFAVYLVYAALILSAGIIAALVARQIRGYVRAALREAKLHSELERINHDLDTARSIQQGLLPTSPPQLDNFEIAGWNQPASQTGGDYFDWQVLPDGQLAISVGDATGHGIGPALVSTSCRAYARASFLNDYTNGHVLERLNGLLANDLSDDRFVTFAVVFLNPVSSEIKVLSAGHGPILWYRRTADELENFEAQGIPLGMISGMSYEDSRLKCLDEGDMLVLVTDGFYEWQNPEAEEFGVLRLKETIRAARDCSAEEVIARLYSAVKDFSKGTEQNDDLTVVVLKRKIATIVGLRAKAKNKLAALTT
ncbi:MAG TPA: PP2C family protein-serine/threonine phosphatase [Pyrinomonadaceae bacterium]|nr:PP2C family protein-serine/threonine phosphatase [Pyrinomonadaceae bacterium]